MVLLRKIEVAAGKSEMLCSGAVRRKDKEKRYVLITSAQHDDTNKECV